LTIGHRVQIQDHRPVFVKPVACRSIISGRNLRRRVQPEKKFAIDPVLGRTLHDAWDIRALPIVS
jgi:hypothetical protein